MITLWIIGGIGLAVLIIGIIASIVTGGDDFAAFLVVVGIMMAIAAGLLGLIYIMPAIVAKWLLGILVVLLCIVILGNVASNI